MGCQGSIFMQIAHKLASKAPPEHMGLNVSSEGYSSPTKAQSENSSLQSLCFPLNEKGRTNLQVSTVSKRWKEKKEYQTNQSYLSGSWHKKTKLESDSILNEEGNREANNLKYFRNSSLVIHPTIFTQPNKADTGYERGNSTETPSRA